MCGYGGHVREGVKEHDMHIELKSCKFKLLGKLVVKEHDMHIEPKSCKFKLLGKLVVQHHIFFPLVL